MSVYLELFHGRDSPDKDLDDWGFQGPVLGPFPFIQVTYGEIKLGETITWHEKEATSNPHYLDPLYISKDGLVTYIGSFYGDFSIFSNPNPELKKQIKETQKVFNTDPALLITHEREWVKRYAEWRFKNEHTNTNKPGTTGRSKRRSSLRDRKNIQRSN
jgi:hypothetical protein